MPSGVSPMKTPISRLSVFRLRKPSVSVPTILIPKLNSSKNLSRENCRPGRHGLMVHSATTEITAAAICWPTSAQGPKPRNASTMPTAPQQGLLGAAQRRDDEQKREHLDDLRQPRRVRWLGGAQELCQRSGDGDADDGQQDSGCNGHPERGVDMAARHARALDEGIAKALIEEQLGKGDHDRGQRDQSEVGGGDQTRQ